MERQTIFQCAGCSTPLMTDKTGVQSQREEGRTLTSRALAWTVITSCQHQSEEAVNLGDLMRLWVRSKGAKFCHSAFHLESHRTPRMTKCFTNRHPFKIRGKACVCGTPLSCRITEPLSNCCSHNPSPLESSKKNTKCMWTCVLLLLLCLWWLLLSWTWSVLWLSCVSLVAVMCTLLCVRPM